MVIPTTWNLVPFRYVIIGDDSVIGRTLIAFKEPLTTPLKPSLHKRKERMGHEHVEAMRAKQIKAFYIMNPEALSKK